MIKGIISHLSEVVVSVLPALLGGIVDYINQIQDGEKSWSWCGFLIHIISAVFFGWLCGAIAAGMGYGIHIIAATGGIGGFLGVRVADLITWKVFGADRRKP